MGVVGLMEALEHVLQARKHLRAAWQIARVEFPELAEAIKPAGAHLSTILQSIHAAVDEDRERRRDAAEIRNTSGTLPEHFAAPKGEDMKEILQQLLGIAGADGCHVVDVDGPLLSVSNRVGQVPIDEFRPAETPATCAMLSAILLGLANEKTGRTCDRGTAAPQLVSNGDEWTLYLYEAGYRATIYPRYKWRGPGMAREGMTMALWRVLVRELSAKQFTGTRDDRKSATVEHEQDDRLQTSAAQGKEQRP